MTRTLIMSLRAGRPEHTPEAEPVVIDIGTPGVVRIELDDGDVIEVDATELHAAITPAVRKAA